MTDFVGQYGLIIVFPRRRARVRRRSTSRGNGARFFFWNATGGIFWATTVSIVAYYFGRGAADAIAHYGLIAGGTLVALALLAWIGVAVWRRRVAEQT